MSFQRIAGAVLLALAAAACSDQAPTAPQLGPPLEAAADRYNPRRIDRGIQRSALLTEIPITAHDAEGAEVPAFLSITRFDAEQTADGVQLSVDGIVSYITEEGQYLAEPFTDVPITLTRAPTASGGSASLAPAGASALQQRGPSETGVCDILYLTLGPLELDLLGLVVDLSNIELDLDAVPGAGRLLGNLLCAVTSLLDGVGALIQILQILGQINDILAAINDLLDGIPAIGSVLSGDATAVAATAMAGHLGNGDFAGSLTITGMSWDESGETLLVDGVLDGKARVGGRVHQIRNATFEDVPATLAAAAAGAPATAPGLHLQRGPNESDVCDVLYLDLAPTFLDLLGLTVDLDQVELDVDAVPGGGRLLGNLLCAVTGLLDGVGGGGLGGLLQGLLQGLLDAIEQILGGLSL